MASDADASSAPGAESGSTERTAKLTAFLQEDENLVRIANYLLSNITTLSAVTIQPGHKKGEVWKAKRLISTFVEMKDADVTKLMGDLGRPKNQVEAALVGNALLRKGMLCEFCPRGGDTRVGRH